MGGADGQVHAGRMRQMLPKSMLAIRDPSPAAATIKKPSATGRAQEGGADVAGVQNPLPSEVGIARGRCRDSACRPEAAGPLRLTRRRRIRPEVLDVPHPLLTLARPDMPIRPTMARLNHAGALALLRPDRLRDERAGPLRPHDGG